MSSSLRPLVGIGIIVIYPDLYPDSVLVSERLSSHEDGLSKHYVTLFMKTIIHDNSTLKCMEPHKNSNWIWVKWSDLNQMKLFAPLKQTVDNSNFNPFIDFTI
ncbi:unnamed protein product [Rotaria sp. Silwood2]|nr:unnamed protein product [Rotaria sp. Silwood2]